MTCKKNTLTPLTYLVCRILLRFFFLTNHHFDSVFIALTQAVKIQCLANHYTNEQSDKINIKIKWILRLFNL